MKTKEQILVSNGFDIEAFKFENENSANNLLLAMDEYAEQNCEQLQNLFSRSFKELKPLEDLYRKENPHSDDKFYLPDTATFFRWIRVKLLNY